MTLNKPLIHLNHKACSLFDSTTTTTSTSHTPRVTIGIEKPLCKPPIASPEPLQHRLAKPPFALSLSLSKTHNTSLAHALSLSLSIWESRGKRRYRESPNRFARVL